MLLFLAGSLTFSNSKSCNDKCFKPVRSSIILFRASSNFPPVPNTLSLPWTFSAAYSHPKVKSRVLIRCRGSKFSQKQDRMVMNSYRLKKFSIGLMTRRLMPRATLCRHSCVLWWSRTYWSPWQQLNLRRVRVRSLRMKVSQTILEQKILFQLRQTCWGH